MNRLWKPWFVHRPRQLARRAAASLFAAPSGYATLRTSWGGLIDADCRRTIGRSIRGTGLHDLAVSEALARLIDAGGTVVDAGANIGYMSVLAARLAGPGGNVLSFEPHPGLHEILRRNVSRNDRGAAPVDCLPLALGDSPGSAWLQLPPDFGSNDGIASVAASRNGEGFDIHVATLDALLQGRRVDVLKIDVEGHEPAVLRGALESIRAGRIRHIVFEDHAAADSEAIRMLQAEGYAVFSLGWRMRGPVVEPLGKATVPARYEAPNFVATRESALVRQRFSAPGWRVLRDLP